MISVNVIGGLGNQMFQYAVGRAISIERGVPLSIDTRDFLQQTMHQGFELDRVFSINLKIAGQNDLNSILGWQSSRFAIRLLSRPEVACLRSKNLIIEPYFQYFNEVNNVPSMCYLKGYWQSERYFSAYANTIRTDFSFRSPMSNLNEQLAKKIKKVNAVSLHVRRGDYISNEHTFSVHGVCSPEYYANAVRYVSENVENPIFFIFSDDQSWVKENLKIDFPCYFVDHNRGAESYNDMRLMSLCRHHIIANSSFSWWGAWLNPRSDKIVVAPSRWFADDSRVVDDVIPDNWVKL